jgi:hypothetical protein
MHKPTDTGMNRTGAAMSPIDSHRTAAGAEAGNTAPASGAVAEATAEGESLKAERLTWARDAEPLGTVPPPATIKGMMKTAMEKLQGHKPTVFIDKLGERLAFERTGTRLYEAVLAKLDAADAHPGGPSRLELQQIHDAEHRHMALVRDAILQLGADPTAMTPSADLMSVASLGWVHSITDPRTTLNQCLDILMVAEAADQSGWELLVALADQLAFDDLADQFRAALAEEAQHVRKVRSWISQALLGEAGASSAGDAPTQTLSS